MDVNVNREGRKDLWGSSHSLFFQVSFFLRRGFSTSRVLHVEHSFYGTETWTLRKIDQIYMQNV